MSKLVRFGKGPGAGIAKASHPGDQVTITKGSFVNFVAEVAHIAPDRRVWVLLGIMGGQTRVAFGDARISAV